jgi:hypothetical protein
MSCEESKVFDDLNLDETDLFSFDFTALLGTGQTINTPTIVATVISGTHATPSAIIIGSVTLDATAKIASVLIKGIVAGVTYCLAMKALQGSRELIVPGQLTVVSVCT